MKIPIRAICSWLILAILILIVLHVYRGLFPGLWQYEFDLDGEANLPTWFATLLLSSIAVTAFVIHQTYRREKDFVRRTFWLIFGSVFVFLSLDEFTQIHERLALDEEARGTWVLYYAPLAALFLGLCLYYCLVIRKKDRALQLWLLGGLIIFAAGGIGAEAILYIVVRQIMHLPIEQFRFIEVPIEEGLEKIGSSIVLMGCLHELSRLYTIQRIEQTETSE